MLVLREMAENAPAVFNVHVKPFLDSIWGGLRDSRVHVREASVQALQVSHRAGGQAGGGKGQAGGGCMCGRSACRLCR